MSQKKPAPKHLELLVQKRLKEQRLIAAGAIYKYLCDRPKGAGDIAIAADLNLSTPLVRKELGDLVAVGKVLVSSVGFSDLGIGGLIYKIAED